MLKDMKKLKMWHISIHADRDDEGEIGRHIQVTYKGKLVKGIQSLSMLLFKRKLDEGGNLLIQDSKLREVN